MSVWQGQHSKACELFGDLPLSAADSDGCPGDLTCVCPCCCYRRLAPLPSKKAQTVREVLSKGLAFLDEGR